MVVDDQYQQISHIIRGIDLLDSTPKQLYLQHLLNFSTPTYSHLPIIINETGQKLSKQTHAKAIEHQQPEKILFQILSLLKQQPPSDLKKASVDEILTWGIQHWNQQALTNLKTLPDPS